VTRNQQNGQNRKFWRFCQFRPRGSAKFSETLRTGKPDESTRCAVGRGQNGTRIRRPGPYFLASASAEDVL
jgi:hypothetical protein